ncbi:MAG: iron ABC transporter permease [Alphaproteobacteria bacterium]
MGKRATLNGLEVEATRGRSRDAVIIGSLAIAVLLLALYTITVGPYPLTLGQIGGGFFRLLTGSAEPAGGQVDTVLFSVRLPRIAASLLVGAALAAAGTVYQGLFRNPLVSPDILGVSTGAGLGAVVGILLSLPVVMIQGLAFAGGLITVLLVYAIATAVRGHEPTLVLVLSGVVLGALAGACISLVKILADPYDQLPAITFWLLGSLAGVTSGDVRSALPAVLLGLVPLVLLRWRMNLMALGDEEATALGIEPKRLRALFIAAATLMTASVVAISGVIGWVGLVMPHIARLVIGPNFDRLLPTAMLMGAGYLLLVDTVARTLAQTETPLGILTAFLGAPVFLWLLATGRRSW